MNPTVPSTSTQTASRAACPECDGAVNFDRAPIAGQVCRCASCGAELEVTSASPLTLTLAPEVEEDWGE